MQQQVDIPQVFKVVTHEALARMKLPIDSWRASALRRFGDAMMPRFGGWLSDLDKQIGLEGIRAAAHTSLTRMGQTTIVSNAVSVPKEGPVLILANHPGAYDVAHLLAATPRDDSRVIAGTDAFDLLPHGKHHFLYTSNAKRKRKLGETTQMIIDALRKGECIMMFPRGAIEPDPRWLPGARQTLQHWRRSMERIAESVPDLTTVPASLSGSLSRKALEHWSVRFYGNQMLRARGAAILQTGSSLARPDQWRTDVSVQFGTALSGADELFGRVSAEMNRLYTLARDPEWPITSRANGWLG